MNIRPALIAAAAGVALCALPSSGYAQQGEPTGVVRKDPIPQRGTLNRLMKPITVTFDDIPMQDAVEFVAQVTGAEIEALWDVDGDGGLDPEQPVSLDVEGVTALAVLEKLLAQARDQFGFGTGSTWQMTEWGAIQIGPKELLNSSRTLKIYPVSDLILEVPNFAEAPAIDLNAALQGSQGGGGQSPFTNINEDQREFVPAEERAQPIIDMVITLVEPEQWEDNGGSGASVRYWQGNLLVNAPDYIHRGINGYTYWPADATIARTVNGRRYITMGVDSSISTVEGFDQQPVTGTTGGGAPPPTPDP